MNTTTTIIKQTDPQPLPRDWSIHHDQNDGTCWATFYGSEREVWDELQYLAHKHPGWQFHAEG